jgi:hypothetical protein
MASVASGTFVITAIVSRCWRTEARMIRDGQTLREIRD